MATGKIVYILGDIHGDFVALNYFINKHIRQSKTLRSIVASWKGKGEKFEVVILQCGDFAYFWPREDATGAIKNHVDFLEDGYVPIYWCAGNHEDHDKLDSLFANGVNPSGIVEVDRKVFFCRFGATLELTPDINVFFAGGAESNDIKDRLKDMAEGSPRIWWPQEGISEEDLDRLDINKKVDWVISHTAPNAFDVTAQILRSSWDRMEHFCEPSRRKLEHVKLVYNPKRWYFGHFHKHMTGKIDSCDWMCLSYVQGSDKWFEKVYLEY